MSPEPGDEGTYYLEELHVGQRFVSGTHLVNREQITGFAREFDPQPFHLDEEAAKTTLFGSLAASGWHTAAITMKLLTEKPPFIGGIIGAGGDIAWPRPTRPGDILQVTSEILEIIPSRTHPERGRVILRAETRNQRKELVQVLTARLVVPRRTPDKADGATSDTYVE